MPIGHSGHQWRLQSEGRWNPLGNPGLHVRLVKSMLTSYTDSYGKQCKIRGELGEMGSRGDKERWGVLNEILYQAKVYYKLHDSLSNRLIVLKLL